VRKHGRSALNELRGSLIRNRYLQECRKYLPELTFRICSPIRPASAPSGAPRRTLVHDFMFADTPRMVGNVLNAPSPPHRSLAYRKSYCGARAARGE